MSVTEIKHDGESRDCNVIDAQLRAGADEPRVIDFYRTIHSPFFGAVVSRVRAEYPSVGREGSQERQDRPTLVTVVGELDLSNAPLLDECLTGIVGDIVVDCSGLDFIGARGLRSLVTAHVRAQQAGARFVIVEPSPSMLRLLRVAGVDACLEIRLAQECPR
jgi:anti-anti-sigma factor